MQLDPAASTPVPLQGELAVDQGQDDRLVDYAPGPIDNSSVAGEDADPDHAVASHAHHEVCRRVLDQQLVEVEGRSR